MERVETPRHKSQLAKAPKRLSLYLNALEGEEANWTLVRHLMHSGWDTRSDPAQWLPAGPDGHSLGWCELNFSDPGKKKKKKNLFFFVHLNISQKCCQLRQLPVPGPVTGATSSPVRAADELSECSVRIVVIMTNLPLVYASDE